MYEIFNKVAVKAHLFVIFLSLLFFTYHCASSTDSYDNDAGNPFLTVVNIQAEYIYGDSVWRVKGDMIKELTLIDNYTGERRTFDNNITKIFGEDSTKTIKYDSKGGSWNIEIIDYRNLMRDTTIAYPTYGEYTVRIPLILDNLSPFEISKYQNTLGRGRVIFDTIDD